MTTLSGQQTVSSGQAINGTTIVAGGAVWIMSGGSATATTIDKGQMLVAGVASQTTVEAGGLSVMYGGSVHGTQVYNGGVMEVDYRSFAYNTTVHNGGIEILGNNFFPSGGDAGLQSAGTVLNGGILIADDYATIENVTVKSGAEIVYVGGHDGDATIEKGAKVIYGTVNAGAKQTGGVITFFSQTVRSGGVVGGALIRAGGQIVSSGGRVQNETLKEHSTLQIGKGGHSLDITISNGCTETVVGSAVNTTLEAQTKQVVSAGGFVKNTDVEHDAKLTLYSGSTAIGTTISGGTVEVATGATAHAITFATSGGRLQEDSLPTGLRLYGFGVKDKLDLLPVNGSKARVSFKENAKGTAGILTVSDGVHMASVTLFGQYVAGGFHRAGDGVAGGTLILYTPPEGSSALVAASTR